MKIAITGATSGIGLETAKVLLQKGHQLIFLVRDVAKAENILKDIDQACDLADLASVKKAALELQKNTDQLDVLINNAGGTFKERSESKDGFELHLAVNHLGHYLLVNNCLDYLKKHNTKIINVSSEAHRAAKLDFKDLNLESDYNTIRAYGNAKLYNILFSKSLADNGLTSYALHPGVINSGFGDNLSPLLKLFWFLGKPFMKNARQGASTSIYLATNTLDDSKNGAYFKDRKVISCSKEANKKATRDKLWEESEKLVEEFLER